GQLRFSAARLSRAERGLRLRSSLLERAIPCELRPPCMQADPRLETLSLIWTTRKQPEKTAGIAVFKSASVRCKHFACRCACCSWMILILCEPVFEAYSRAGVIGRYAERRRKA